MKKKRKNSKQFNQRFRKRFFTKKSVTVIICVVIILVAVAFGCQDLRKRAERYENTIDELSTEIRDIKDTNQTLEDERNNMDSAEFKEKMAREKLGMIGEDEYSLQQSENGDSRETAGADSGKSVEEKDKQTDAADDSSAADDEEDDGAADDSDEDGADSGEQ